MRPLLSRVPPRAAGAALVCLAAASAAWAAVPRTSGTDVLVAARDLSPGTALEAEDVRTARYPDELMPADPLTDPSEAADTVLGSGLSAGSPLTGASIMAPETGPSEPGTLLVPTVFGDAQAASAIRPGHRLRIYSAAASALPSSGDDAVTEDEDRVDVPGPDDTSGAGALVEDATVTAVQTQGTALGQGTTVVTLAVADIDAARLARASGSYLSFALLN